MRQSVVISTGVLMTAIVIGLTLRQLSFQVEASTALIPSWTPAAMLGAGEIRENPVENTPTSRLFYLWTSGGGNLRWRVDRVNDDGSVSSGTVSSQTLHNFGPRGFVSDGLDGAYTAWISDDLTNSRYYVSRVGSTGNQLWTRDLGVVGLSNSPEPERSIGTLSNGNLYALSPKSASVVCANIMNRSNGVPQWTSTAGCGQMRSVLNPADFGATSGISTASVADSTNGFIFYAQANVPAGDDVNVLRRVNNAGSTVWTTNLNTVFGEGAVVKDMVKIDDTIYASLLLYPSDRRVVHAFRESDGTPVWPGELELPNYPYSFVQSGSNEIAIFYPLSGKSYVNRINIQDGSFLYPAPVEVFSFQPSSSLYTNLVSNFPLGTVMALACQNSEDDCFVQGVTGSGDLLFPEGAKSLPDKTSNGRFEAALHERTIAGGTESCLDTAHYNPDQVRQNAQMYCFSEGPTLSTPLCSVDNGGSFTLCSDATIGKTVSHVQVSCTPGEYSAFSEGPFANNGTLDEASVVVDGRYIAYEDHYHAFAPFTPEVYFQDLGPDQIYQTNDDGPRTRLTNNSSVDRPMDIDRSRVLIGYDLNGPDTSETGLRIYDIATSGYQPGTLYTGDYGLNVFSSAALDGRYLAYSATQGGFPEVGMFDLGPDEQLGTSDDGSHVVLDNDWGAPNPPTMFVGGKYAFAKAQGNSATLYDLETHAEVATFGGSIDGFSFDGRYAIGWDDDHFSVNDFGPDLTYETADDQLWTQISSQGESSWPGEVHDGSIVWSAGSSLTAGDWNDYDTNVYRLDAGADGRFGSADDIGPYQITNETHMQATPVFNDQAYFWVDNREGSAGDFSHYDIYTTPIGADSSTIDEVRFTMTAPSGAKYTDQAAGIVNGDTYALHYPTLIDESGSWRVQATCVDSHGTSATNEVVWDAGIWPFSNDQKLSAYNGVGQIAKSDGDAMEIGNRGRDLASTGHLYFRPNNSYAGMVWEGSAGTASQRLHIPLGITGQPAVLAQGYGTVDSTNGANAIGGYFDGAANDAAGAGVSGDVTSCGSSGGCAGGRFDGRTFVGLHVQSYEASFPALYVANGAGANGVAANLDGNVTVTGNLEAIPVSFPACSWVTVIHGDTVCPNNGFIAGFDETSNGVADKVYCCGN